MSGCIMLLRYMRMTKCKEYTQWRYVDHDQNIHLQVLLGKSGCTEKVDMYSYGVVLWELCTGESPTGRQLRPVK